jgi:uncharacterized MAPEG superfamily protein
MQHGKEKSTITADVKLHLCARLGYINFYVIDGDGLLYVQYYFLNVPTEFSICYFVVIFLLPCH